MHGEAYHHGRRARPCLRRRIGERGVARFYTRRRAPGRRASREGQARPPEVRRPWGEPHRRRPVGPAVLPGEPVQTVPRPQPDRRGSADHLVQSSAGGSRHGAGVGPAGPAPRADHQQDRAGPAPRRAGPALVAGHQDLPGRPTLEDRLREPRAAGREAGPVPGRPHRVDRGQADLDHRPAMPDGDEAMGRGRDEPRLRLRAVGGHGLRSCGTQPRRRVPRHGGDRLVLRPWTRAPGADERHAVADALRHRAEVASARWPGLRGLRGAAPVAHGRAAEGGVPDRPAHG